jgi:hypothetical protein
LCLAVTFPFWGFYVADLRYLHCWSDILFRNISFRCLSHHYDAASAATAADDDVAVVIVVAV